MSEIATERLKKKFKLVDVPGRGLRAVESQQFVKGRKAKRSLKSAGQEDEEDSSDLEECSDLSHEELPEESVEVGKTSSCREPAADEESATVDAEGSLDGGLNSVTTDNVALDVWKKQMEEKLNVLQFQMERQKEVLKELAEQNFDILHGVPEVEKKSFSCSGRVKSIDLHPTLPWLLLALFDGKAIVWNYQSSIVEKSLQVSEKPVRCAKFLARKKWIITGSDDKLVQVFDYSTWEKACEFEAHSDSLRSIAVHPTKPHVLTAGDDKTVKLWNWDKNWSLKRTFSGHTHIVLQVAINPEDGSTFASASFDGTIKLWRFNSEAPIGTLEGHGKPVNCIGYYHEGKKTYLISGGDDKLIKVWDCRNGNCITTLEGHTENVTAVCTHPDLPLILSGSEDSNLGIYNASTYRVEETVPSEQGRIWCLQGVKGTREVAVGHDNGLSMIKIPKVAYFDLDWVRKLGPVMVTSASGGEIDLASVALEFKKQHLLREQRSKKFLSFLLRKVVQRKDIPKYIASVAVNQYRQLPPALNLPVKRVFCAAHGIRLDDSGALDGLPPRSKLSLYTQLGTLYRELVDLKLSLWKDKDPDKEKPKEKPKSDVKTEAKAKEKEEESEDDDPIAVYRRKALAETNKYRKRHGAPPLVLDPKINAHAQEWAEYLANSNAFYHRQPNKYGENLAMYGQSESAVQLWYEEVHSYGYGYGGFSMATGHFTQLVWRSSKRAGFGIAKNPYTGMTIVVGEYDPPGNCQGRFQENVLPPQ